MEGVPFYELTQAGLLVASSIEELGNNRMRILESYITSITAIEESEKIMYNGFLLLIKLSPSFVSKIINEYIYAYSTGLVDNIIPMDVKKLKHVISKRIAVERELLEAFDALQEDQRELVKKFLKVLG
jgi:hypothetical protein